MIPGQNQNQTMTKNDKMERVLGSEDMNKELTLEEGLRRLAILADWADATTAKLTGSDWLTTEPFGLAYQSLIGAPQPAVSLLKLALIVSPEEERQPAPKGPRQIQTESACFDVAPPDQGGLEAGEIAMKMTNHANETMEVIVKRDQLTAAMGIPKELLTGHDLAYVAAVQELDHQRETGRLSDNAYSRKAAALERKFYPKAK